METPQGPCTDAITHLTAAGRLLAAPAAHARKLAASGSPHASSGGEAARKHVERLRSQLRRMSADMRALEEGLEKAQGWHTRYEHVKRTA